VSSKRTRNALIALVAVALGAAVIASSRRSPPPPPPEALSWDEECDQYGKDVEERVDALWARYKALDLDSPQSVATFRAEVKDELEETKDEWPGLDCLRSKKGEYSLALDALKVGAGAMVVSLAKKDPADIRESKEYLAKQADRVHAFRASTFIACCESIPPEVRAREGQPPRKR
jgi:hypothetical protein